MTNQDSKSMMPNAGAAAAGVAGAVIGAGIAVAATAALSNKHTRDKVKETLVKVKDQVMDSIHEGQNNAQAEVKEIKSSAKKS
jgi:hypothetical protein